MTPTDMDIDTAGALERVIELVSSDWPTEPAQVTSWALRVGIPRDLVCQSDSHVQHGPVETQIWCQDRIPYRVGWIIDYGTNQELQQAHQAFIIGVSQLFGDPIDATPSTVLWRDEVFLIEAYAHALEGQARRTSHQVSVALTERADAVEARARADSPTSGPAAGY